ncbi:MORN repeat-containing protein 3 [Eucyclogobius newberryi]|uniref:MORN repeat-containing protein 3 n=1 Tax=Eucyclogobius newberryi TaxID=166745 RepID=UPI003B5A02D9
MEYLRPTEQKQPLSTLLDEKAQNWGLKRTVYSVNGNEYTGEWQDNKKHGKGTQVWKKTGAIYDGEWKCGMRDGHGTYSVLNPQSNQYSRKYCGDWKNGKKHGFGTFLYSCSGVYEGEWSEDIRCGWGRMHYANGDIYEGEWWKDKNHGKGIMRSANGNLYEGSWRDGKKNGYGKFFYTNQGQLYEGFWLDGTAKCGTLSDFGRNEAPRPPKYQIPQLQLVDMQGVLTEAQSAYNDFMTTVTQE